MLFAQSLLSLVPSDLWESLPVLTDTVDADRWARRAHWSETSFWLRSRITVCWLRFFCNNLLWGAKSWCRYRIGFSWHRENFSSRLPPFFPPLFVFRCLSEGPCFFGKLTTVSLFNYVHFCCLLLHAVSGPLCVADLLRNMARKYLRTGVFRLSFKRVDGLVTGDLSILDAQVC